MPFGIIRPDQFTSIHDIFTDPTAVFIIPSFQRPFAWEDKHLEDLLDDMAKAHTDGREHYLSALHLIEVSSATLTGADNLPDSLAIGDFLDAANPDIKQLADAARTDRLFTNQRQPLKIYAVVDGQQRLTTLYLLACRLSADDRYSYLKLREYLTIAPQNSDALIPKLIQNPSDDHVFLQKMIAGAGRDLKPTTQAQRRLKTIYGTLAKGHHAFEYFKNHEFKTSVLLLDSNHGLTSFLTLNDRGKKLTVLEVLKSFLMERTIDVGDNDLLRRLHNVFGKLYQVLDKCQEEKVRLMKVGDEGDSQLVQLIAIYLWAGTYSEIQWHSGESAYREFFRKKLLDTRKADDIRNLLNIWIVAMEEVAEQLAQLVKYLSGETGF